MEKFTLNFGKREIIDLSSAGGTSYGYDYRIEITKETLNVLEILCNVRVDAKNLEKVYVINNLEFTVSPWGLEEDLKFNGGTEE